MMVDLLVSVKLRQSDVDRMMGECKDDFIRHHKEFRGHNFTKNFMFRKLIDYYLEGDE